MRSFTIRNWFWLADDGRVFDSARQLLVDETDASYAAWAEGAIATRWPVDDAGDQTVASLQAVLSPFGIWVDLTAYAADLRWRKEVGGIAVAGIPVATDDRSKLMIAGASIAAGRDEDWETIWHGADGNTYPIGAAAMLAISAAVEAHVNATFATFASVKADIDSGTITTAAQIDGAFA